MKTPPKILLAALLLSFIFSSCLKAQKPVPAFLEYKDDAWVKQQLDSLTLEEKIAQLMMITVYPEQNESHKNSILKEIKEYKPGGILIMEGSPNKTASWINQFQEKSDLPLLVATDGEWGASMRIDSTIVYPYAQTLGAIQDGNNIYQMGKDLAEQLNMLGINMNFAPVADINTNPMNPVINFRSFGKDKINVAQKAWMLAKGMQDQRVVAVAKHFPGHGDTKTDSHKTLPLVPHSKARIDEIESYPFRYLSDKGIIGIMTAHLDVPALDKNGKTSSLSKQIVSNYLKDEIGFTGFVVTDALNMKGVRSKPGKAELEAIKAGNDMAEFVLDLPKAIKTIKEESIKNPLLVKEINEKCLKILALKRWIGLNNYSAANLKNLNKRLNAPKFKLTHRKLIKSSFTLLTNDSILPLQNLDKRKIASLSIGYSKRSKFQTMLGKYTAMDHFVLSKNATEEEWVKLCKKLNNYNLVVIGVNNLHRYPSRKFGTTILQRKAVSEIIEKQKTIVTFFGNAAALSYFSNIERANALVLAHQNLETTQELAAQLIFGAFTVNGKLPIDVDVRFKLNAGLELKKNNCLSYGLPEEVGMNSEKLHAQIDSIAELGIKQGAYPGCQVLVAKNGNVIFHKCYGFHTYDSIRKVSTENIYDWASVTKVTGSLPAIMKLVDEKKINIDNPFSIYWPDFKNSNKKNLRFREILAHQAGLASWIPFWKISLKKNGKLDKTIFSDHPSKKINVRVSRNTYMNPNFRKIMFDTIRTSELKPQKKYLYSGLCFYLYPTIIENLTGKDYEKYLKETFFHPLGAYTITHNAYKYFPLKQIIPTENDDFFRMEKLHGFVHDEGASMMGGISGNAGLFGTTNDLAKVFQMYLQKGYFGGRRYISEKTIDEFTRVQFPKNENRRGLGFDKPLINNHENELEEAYPSPLASAESFGHSGYTGTFAWADPKNNLLFIFMSNRVHPTRKNSKLYKLNIRTAMHQAVYKSIESNLN